MTERRHWTRQHLFSVVLGLLVLVAATLSVFSPGTTAQQPRIYTAELTGVFSELTADYTIRVLERAEQDNVPLLLFIDSPGGIDRAVRRLNHALLTSEVPVIAYIGPAPDAEALSGAFLIALAAHQTLIHPDAHIGSSAPPGIWDRFSAEEREERIELASQIANRTALARERDPDQVDRIIFEQVIFNADEALNNGIVEGIAEDTQEALETVHGREVQTYTGPAVIQTENARLVEISMTWWEITLRTITNPSVAYSLLSIGLLLLVVELFNPGRLIAGIPAVICLVLAFVALGNLPVSWFGMAMLFLATVLFIAELRTPWIGVLGAIGLIAYVAGSMSFYRPLSTMSAFAPDVRVETWVIIATMAGWVIILLLTLRALFRARESEFDTRMIDLTGQQGVVIETLAPRGVVRINEQEWAAVSGSGELQPGAQIVVDEMAGGVLQVSPVEENAGAISDPGSATGRPAEQPPEPTS